MAKVASLTASDGQGTSDVKPFAERFWSNLFEHVSAWLADAKNGLGEVFARVFNASEKICVDGECLTADDIRALKAGAYGASGFSPSSESPDTDKEPVYYVPQEGYDGPAPEGSIPLTTNSSDEIASASKEIISETERDGTLLPSIGGQATEDNLGTGTPEPITASSSEEILVEEPSLKATLTPEASESPTPEAMPEEQNGPLTEEIMEE